MERRKRRWLNIMLHVQMLGGICLPTTESSVVAKFQCRGSHSVSFNIVQKQICPGDVTRESKNKCTDPIPRYATFSWSPHTARDG
eukprot:3320110-Amphidinium_carterae.1